MYPFLEFLLLIQGKSVMQITVSSGGYVILVFENEFKRWVSYMLTEAKVREVRRRVERTIFT